VIGASKRDLPEVPNAIGLSEEVTARSEHRQGLLIALLGDVVVGPVERDVP
jgi:hypothetical protein